MLLIDTHKVRYLNVIQKQGSLKNRWSGYIDSYKTFLRGPVPLKCSRTSHFLCFRDAGVLKMVEGQIYWLFALSLKWLDVLYRLMYFLLCIYVH